MNGQARRRHLSLLVGAVLVAAAIGSVASHRGVLDAAWSSLRDPSPAWAACLPLAVLVSFAATAGGLTWLTNRVVPLGRVSWPEMFALTLSSALGNLFPMQAGLVGRIAYQQRVHGIPATVGVLLAVQSSLITLAAAAWVGVVLLIVRVGGLSWIAVPASLLPAFAMVAAVPASGRAFAAAFALRLSETMLSAVRAGAAFQVVGAPIDPEAALTFAVAAQLANVVPMVGGGLGIREWAVALLAPAVTGLSTPEALAAELVHRAAELLVVVPGGLAASLPLARRVGMATRARRSAAPATPMTEGPASGT